PQRAVVHLERVVPTVLAGPELHVVGTEVAHHAGGLGAQLVGEPAHARVGAGEGAAGEGAGVDLRSDTDDAQPGGLQGGTDLLVAELAAEERVVQVHHVQVTDPAGQLDRVQHGARLAVAVGRVPVHVGGE